MIASAILGLGPWPGPEGGFVGLDRARRNGHFVLRHHRFAVVAHRGNHVAAPENTLDAFNETIRVGADYAEIDLRTTKDGAIVLMHDGTVDRMTDGHGPVRSLTLDQIRSLHIKGARRPEEKVPTFDETLDLVKGKIDLYLDIKDVTPQQVLPVLLKHHMERNVIAYLYDGQQIDEWRTNAPKIPIIADVDLKQPDQVERDWGAHPFAISDGGAFRYKQPFVDTFHRLRVLVWPDIQNPLEGPSQWQPFIDMDVDGFQTDHPEALIKYLTEKGIR